MSTDDWDDQVFTEEEEEPFYEEDPIIEPEYFPPDRWVPYSYGVTDVLVSDKGKIKLPGTLFHITDGYGKLGTPYRIYPFKLEDGTIIWRYVHDVVWEAFNGKPCEGYEVRHSLWETKRGEQYYSNALEDLQIYLME